jgi:hypothetical protein
MNLLRYCSYYSSFILRSLDMDLYRIILSKDNDWEIISELGQIGIKLNKGGSVSSESLIASNESDSAADTDR